MRGDRPEPVGGVARSSDPAGTAGRVTVRKTAGRARGVVRRELSKKTKNSRNSGKSRLTWHDAGSQEKKTAGRARDWCGANFLRRLRILGILGNRGKHGMARDLKETGRRLAVRGIGVARTF